MMGFQALRQAYRTDVSPIVARARVASGGAVDVLATYRASGWRQQMAGKRKAMAPGTGIV
jgi:L-rhamnose isomerase/sugar isomerase